MEINIFEYLHPDEIREIAREEFRRIIQNDSERILNNMAYDLVFEAVNQALDDSAKDFIKAKAISVINDLSAYMVFREKDMWGNKNSLAYDIIQETVKENKELIKSKVIEVINERDYVKDFGYACESMHEILVDIFIKGLEK